MNFLFYQVGWFACVLGVSWNLPWIGVTIALFFVSLHFWLAADRMMQIQLALTVAALGLVVDSGQLWAGVFEFPRGSVVAWLPPPLMTVLWLQFATTLRYSMEWLSGRYVLAACFGLFGAPLAFCAGEKLGAIQFQPPQVMNFAILGLIWSCAVPLIVLISDRLAARFAVGSMYRWPAMNGSNRAGT